MICPHNVVYLVNTFVFSLDVIAMIKILYEMIEIQHEISDVIYLY